MVEVYLPVVCRRHSRGQGLLSTIGFPKLWCWYSLEMHVIRTQSVQELKVMVIPDNHSPEMANIERILQDWSPEGKMCDTEYENDSSFQHCSVQTLWCMTVMAIQNGTVPRSDITNFRHNCGTSSTDSQCLTSIGIQGAKVTANSFSENLVWSLNTG